MDRYGDTIIIIIIIIIIILIIIIVSMGSFAFTPPSQVYNHQSLPQPTTEYHPIRTIHNPFFVGALVATYIHTAVMYDAPWQFERLMFDTNPAVTL